MNRIEIAQILSLCSSAYPHVVVTKETAIVYAEMLADLDVAIAASAVKKHIATSQYFPTIAAIRELCAAISNPAAPTLARAWFEVIQEIKTNGLFSTPEWSHPSIATTVATIGWRELCLSENQAVLRAHFWKVYDVVSREQQIETILPTGQRAIKS